MKNLAQGVSLLASIVEKVRKLAYKFIWDGRKWIPWNQMILPKAEGGLGVRDLPMISRAVSIKRASKFWERIVSILVQWIQ